MENYENVDLQMTIELDDGRTLDCDVIVVFTIHEQQYVALAPVGDNPDEIFLYRFKEENGEPILSNIESDEEYEIVCDRFDEILDEAEWEDADANSED